MDQRKPPDDAGRKGVPPVTNPNMDVGQVLQILIGDTGGVHESFGGFKIKVYHVRAFPWGEVFKTLLYRDFRVYVTRHKADLYVEAAV
jgi:hypothetical protein